MKSAWRMLARDWRAGELGVLAAALVIAVASVTSVGFFADRVSQALERDAHQLLGADLVLAADHPWGARIVERPVELADRDIVMVSVADSPDFAAAWRWLATTRQQRYAPFGPRWTPCPTIVTRCSG